MTKPLIFIGSDHRGFALKEVFTLWLREKGYDIRDVGPSDGVRCDAGDYAQKVAESMKSEPASLGVLICGTGQAMAMTANRFAHIRAALCTDTTMARLARQHNDANVLTIGADVVGQEVACDCLSVFLATPFLDGRYRSRIEKLIHLGGL